MIIENIEIPADATNTSGSKEKYPFSSLNVGAGFTVAADKVLSAKSALSRYRGSSVDANTIEVFTCPDTSLIMRRVA
jgi:hypothetical protein